MKKIIAVFCTLLLAFSLLTLSVGATEYEDDAVVTESSEETAESVFGAVYDQLVINADKILSALAFLASLILTFSYKKGLYPIVKATLSRLTGAVKEISERAEGMAESSDENAKLIYEKIEESEKILNTLSSNVSELEGELKKLEEKKSTEESFKIILRAQVDMLYEIFMSSSLPQYSKDAVGEKIGAMKAALCSEEKNEE